MAKKAKKFGCDHKKAETLGGGLVRWCNQCGAVQERSPQRSAKGLRWKVGEWHCVGEKEKTKSKEK